MKYKQYTAYIKKIISSCWFKEEIKLKNIKIIYLQSNLEQKYINIYFKFDCDRFYNRKYISKLININLKNKTIYQVKILLQQLQEKFIISGFLQDLNFHSRKDFIELYKEKFDGYIDNSILSKVLNNNTIKVKNNLYTLNLILPSKVYLYSIYIKAIISDKPHVKDREVSQILKVKYNINYKRKQICNLRAKYLIPSFDKREISKYLINEKFYTQKIVLKKENVNMLLSTLCGVYELSSQYYQHYTLVKSMTVYIGSSKNIKNRLYSYSTNNGHTELIKKFIKKETVYFRYIKIQNYKEYEKIFLENFKTLSGDLPLLNQNNVF